jgi:5-methylcytosine-specific restriction endonuclease McrA
LYGGFVGRPRKGFEPSEEEKKEHARIRSARYYKLHPDRAKESSRRWRDKNRKRVNEIASRYAKSHREQYKIYCIVRRTAKTEAGGSYTPKQWKYLCERYKNLCLCCGKHKRLTADHVIPVSKGGSSDISNIQPLCGLCNSKKGSNTTDYRRTQYGTRRVAQKVLG